MTTATAEKPAVETPEKVNAKRTRKIASRVKGGKIVKVNLGEIRDEYGAGRIGKKVLGHMAEFLNENGIGAFPGWVLDPEQNPEPRQWQEVHLYERDGSARSVLLDAFSDYENNDLVAALDLFTGESPDFSAMDADARLAFVRAAVCG
jgi:hypothetical protein